MTVLLENPFPILAIGGLAIAILFGGLVKTGQAKLILAMMGVILLTTLLLVVERVVVTEKERIAATLHRIAVDLESDNIPAVMGHISADSPELQDEAERVLKRVRVKEVKIKRNLQVEFDSRANQAEATARFNAVVVGSERQGLVENQHGAWYFIVQMKRENDQWRVVRYERRDPREGM